MNTREFLKTILYTREEIDGWMSHDSHKMELYDPELGWTLRSCQCRDGVDGSISRYRFGADSGPRQMIAYADRPCRVNTYGDSMTQCHQVSDGETWQEVLAAHLGEPVRNYGIGGFSVYQAWRRLLREERRTPAKYIIFHVFSDDHFRNLPCWRRIRSRRNMFMSPPLPHVDANPATGEFVEHENACPTRESLYSLCDLEWAYEHFKDDFSLQIEIARENVSRGTPAESYATIRTLASQRGLGTMKIDSAESLTQAIDRMQIEAAIFASTRIVEKLEDYAAKQGRKVLYLLSFGGSQIADGGRTAGWKRDDVPYDSRRVPDTTHRFDRDFVRFLRERGLPFVDLLEAHHGDFVRFNLTMGEYSKRYFVGHYAPLGNFFVAHSLKDKLVELLDPKPPAYRVQGLSADPTIAYDYGLA